MTTPETAVKKKIISYLDSVPGLWHVAFHNTGYTRKGIPDRLCCYRGRFVALEIKAPGGVASPWQRREIAAIVETGGIAEVVWSVEQVQAIIARIDDTLTTDDLLDSFARTRGRTVKQMPDGTYQRVPLKF